MSDRALAISVRVAQRAFWILGRACGLACLGIGAGAVLGLAFATVIFLAPLHH